jgi:asparagine synthase (glutamine-hydrolysing)
LALDGKLAVVFDGRLDNAADLSRDLGLQALSPASIALASYAASPQDFPASLKGDFAIAIYDSEKDSLLLARDVMGGRTLYYASIGERIIFASEIKCILALPGFSTKPNDSVLAEFLFRNVDQRNLEETFFTGVKNVPPAHAVVITKTATQVRRYWDFSTKRIDIAQQDAIEKYRELFLNAVRRRLSGDQPVAITVSGGLDSTSIFCAALHLQESGEKIPPIHGVSFFSDREGADERSYVADVEKKYNVKVPQFRLPKRGLLNDYPDQAWIMEAPFLQWNALHSLYQAAKAVGARRFLSGFFGDQILLSPLFIMDDLLRLRLAAGIKSFREYLIWGGENVPLSVALSDFFLECKGFLIPEKLRPGYQRLRKALRGPNPGLPLYSESFHRQAANFESGAVPVRMRPGLAYTKGILHQVYSRKHATLLEMDVKLSSSYGLELTHPFRDRDLIQFMLSLYGRSAYPEGTSRGIHREAMKGILPESVRLRRTKGDYTPEINHAITADVDQFISSADDLLGSRLGYLPTGSDLRKSLQSLAQSLDSESARALWSLADVMGLEAWLNTFFGAKLQEPSQAEVKEHGF